MKKMGLLVITLIFIIFCAACVSRVENPLIEVTATQQQTGTHVVNYVDVENTYVISFNITNNASVIAKNVKIKYSYCDDNRFKQYCHNGSINDIGDLQPYQSIIREVAYDRTALNPIVFEKFQLRYSADSEQ
jgi:LPS O-antigen subunit length determinant protein (WzzB/FepE family)